MSNAIDFLKKTYDENTDDINSPAWEIVNGVLSEGRYVHSWERYIPDQLKYEWDSLSNETKAALFVVGQEAADQEEWD